MLKITQNTGSRREKQGKKLFESGCRGAYNGEKNSRKRNPFVLFLLLEFGYRTGENHRGRLPFPNNSEGKKHKKHEGAESMLRGKVILVIGIKKVSILLKML